MKLRHALPGIVWMLIGVAIHIYSTTTKTDLHVRGLENIPFSYAVIATGAVIALIGLWRGRKQL
jgi:hypothetical protein